MACVANRSTTVKNDVRPMTSDRNTTPGEGACISISSDFISTNMSVMAHRSSQDRTKADVTRLGVWGKHSSTSHPGTRLGRARYMALVTYCGRADPCGHRRHTE